MKSKNILGQYFTTNNILKDKVYEFILNKPKNILEPSIGQGDLITYIKNKLKNVIFDMYEIDKNIKLLNGINKNSVVYEDFLIQDIKKKYITIIGNPPYIKTKNGNLYIDFIEKCVNLLDNNGELIFIVPSDFFKLTSASKLLNNMLLNGTFTHIFHPHNEKFFENANIDIIIFRYCKNIQLDKKVLYNNTLHYIINNNGLITFNTSNNEETVLFKDYFDIYVGLVSGKEDVYKNNELGNIDILNGENKIDKYIHIDKFPTDNHKLNNYLLEFKDILKQRKIKKFNDTNWYEWGALRNINIINKYYGDECIYIYNLTRRTKIAFMHKIMHFGGGLIMLKPKKDCNLDNILNYLNSQEFQFNFIFSGRFKIGHRQIYNSNIPVKYL